MIEIKKEKRAECQKTHTLICFNKISGSSDDLYIQDFINIGPTI